MTSESQSMANSFLAEQTKMNAGFTSASLTFRNNGSMEYAYEIKDQGQTRHLTGSYQIYQTKRGTNRPGGPQLLFKNSIDGRITPLTEVNIGQDNRFPMSEELLKFRDLDGKEYWFTRVEDETGEGAAPWEVSPFVSYAKDDPEYKTLHQDTVANPSPRDLWIQSHLAGRWLINVNFVTASLTFKQDGSVDLSYSSLQGENKVEKHGQYNFLPREDLDKKAATTDDGAPQETLPHVEIVWSKGGRVTPLFNLSIAKDDPTHPDTEVLKTRIPNGFAYPLLRDMSDKSLVPDTKGVDEAYAAYLQQLDIFKAKAATDKTALARSLAERLSHKEIQDDERGQLIYKLGQLGDASAVPILSEYVKGAYRTMIRLGAIRALGEIKDKSAVTCLTELLTQPVTGNISDEGEAEAMLRRDAVYALKLIDDHSVLPLMKSLAQSTKDYPSVKNAAQANVISWGGN
jgi:hypothetical protein